MVSALGTRVLFDGPYDFEMTLTGAIIAAKLASPNPWLALLDLGAIALTMAEAHKSPAFMYGLLVQEDDLGFIEVELLRCASCF